VRVARRARRVAVGPRHARGAGGARAGGGGEAPQQQHVGVALVDVDDGGGRRRRLVVLGGEAALVQLVFGRVRLGRRLDVHEGDRGAQAAAALLGGGGRRRRVGPGSRGQQFDALNAAIPACVKIKDFLVGNCDMWEGAFKFERMASMGREVKLQMADFSGNVLVIYAFYVAK
jgi:hypothetical protein